MKLKSLKKKLQRLEADLLKDAKKLAKLQRKVEAALKGEAKRPKATAGVNGGSKSIRPAAPMKKKRNLTPEGRAKLAALMKARWDAKRAGAASAGEPQHIGM